MCPSCHLWSSAAHTHTAGHRLPSFFSALMPPSSVRGQWGVRKPGIGSHQALSVHSQARCWGQWVRVAAPPVSDNVVPALGQRQNPRTPMHLGRVVVAPSLSPPEAPTPLPCPAAGPGAGPGGRGRGAFQPPAQSRFWDEVQQVGPRLHGGTVGVTEAPGGPVTVEDGHQLSACPVVWVSGR